MSVRREKDTMYETSKRRMRRRVNVVRMRAWVKIVCGCVREKIGGSGHKGGKGKADRG